MTVITQLICLASSFDLDTVLTRSDWSDRWLELSCWFIEGALCLKVSMRVWIVQLVMFSVVWQICERRKFNLHRMFKFLQNKDAAHLNDICDQVLMFLLLFSLLNEDRNKALNIHIFKSMSLIWPNQCFLHTNLIQNLYFPVTWPISCSAVVLLSWLQMHPISQETILCNVLCLLTAGLTHFNISCTVHPAAHVRVTLVEDKLSFFRAFSRWHPPTSPPPSFRLRLPACPSQPRSASPSWLWPSYWASPGTCLWFGQSSARWRSAQWPACWCSTWLWRMLSCCSVLRFSCATWPDVGAGSSARQRASWYITYVVWTCTFPSTSYAWWAWIAGWPSLGLLCPREWGTSAPCWLSSSGSGWWRSSCHCQCPSTAGKTNSSPAHYSFIWGLVLEMFVWCWIHRSK